MSDADVAYIRSLLRKLDRQGVFEHKQATGATLDDLMDLSLPENEECYRSTALLGFLFGLRGRSELAGTDFSKDVSFVEADGIFCLDMSHRILKSNKIKKVICSLLM